MHSTMLLEQRYRQWRRTQRLETRIRYTSLRLKATRCTIHPVLRLLRWRRMKLSEIRTQVILLRLKGMRRIRG